MLGFSFIQPRSKGFEHFLNRKKNIRSNGTEMVLNKKTFRIIEFPDRILLKKHQASDSPNLIKIKQFVFELELFKVSPSSKKWMSRNSAQKKIFATQTNTAAKQLCRQKTNQWVPFYLPVTSRGNFAQYSLHASPSVPNIQPSYHFVKCLSMLDVVQLILLWWGEPKERKPQANQLGLN